MTKWKEILCINRNDWGLQSSHKSIRGLSVFRYRFWWVAIKTRGVFLLLFCYSVLYLKPPNISEFKSCYLKLWKISSCMIPKTVVLKFVKFSTRKNYYWLTFPVETSEGAVCIRIYIPGNNLKLISSNRLLATLACISLKGWGHFLSY